MAIEGRKVIENPLALHPKENLPVRQLSLQGVQNPMQTAGNAYNERMAGFFQAMGNLQGGLSALQDQQNEAARTEGQLSYMSGVTEEQMAATGNRYNMQGWQSLSAVDKANKLFMDASIDLENLGHLSPEEYQKHLMDSRKQYLDNLPKDPVVRKMFSAAFADVGPRLAAAHAAKHVEYNYQNAEREFSNLLSSGSVANSDRSTAVSARSELKLSPTVVSTPYTPKSADERHIAILTILGEAAGEGDTGMAAVAHVLKNRSNDPRWGGSIKSVALAPKQFSAWNKGAGGNSPASRYKPGSKLYERAGAVYDAVISGRHVDPTNGATHYYSPSGMKALVSGGSQKNLVPRWYAQEKARSGGEVRIGGHIFVGRASGASVARAPLPDVGAGETPAASETLSVGPGAAFNAGIPGAEPHVDVAESEEDVQRLEREMFNATGSDLEVQPGTPAEDVAEAQQIPVHEARGPQTQVQELIRGFEGLPRDRKAKAVADTIRRQLEDGDDSLYHDAGGIAFLHELGVSATDIDRVRAAYEKFQSKDADKFNIDQERWIQSLKDRAAEGDESVLEEIEQAASEGLDSKLAVSLYRSVSDNLSKVGDNRWKHNPAAQKAIVDLGQAVADGLEPEDIAKNLNKIAAEFNLPHADVEKFMDQMFREYDQRLNKQRTEAAQELEKAKRNNEAIAEVESALSREWGLNDVTGNVTITDENGNKTEISAKQYGVARLQQSEYKVVQDILAKDRNADREDLLATAEKNIYTKLRRHGVIDEKMANYVTAALTGPIMTENGQVSADAVRSLEFYMRMAQNPDVGEDYMAKMVPDPGARALIETARGFYAGRFNLEESLKKAHLALNDPNVDLNKKMATDRVFHREMGNRINDMLNSQFGRTLMGTFLGDHGFATTDMEAARRDAMREGSPLKMEIERAAQAHYMSNPRLSPETAVRLAAQDVANSVDIVAGNLVIGNYKQGRKLSQVMGTDSFGPRATEDAIDAFLEANGEELFGNLMQTERRSSELWDTAARIGNTATLGLFSGESFGYRPGAKTRTMPDYQLLYNQHTGQIGIQLYKAPDNTYGEREHLVGPVKWVDAASLGRKYIEEQGLGKPGMFERGVRSLMENFRSE